MRSATLALAGAAVLTAAGCATDSEPAASAPSSTTTVPATSTTAAAASGPIVVELGTEYDIPCSSVDSSTCMTVTFTDVREGEQCDYLQKDQAIAIDVEAAMPADADPEFISPFRSFPWSTFSSTDEFTQVQTAAACSGDSSQLNLMAEFPGGNAKGTVYLDAPADVRAIVFEPNHGEMHLLEVGN